MQKLIRTLACAALAAAVAGCGIAYRPDIQQGNLLKKENVEQLKPGMTKRQVIALLGTPSVASPFDHDRWDYVSTFAKRGRKPTPHTFTLYFSNDVLERTEGDFFAKSASELLEESKKYHTEYPVNETKGDKDYSDGDKDTKSGG